MARRISRLGRVLLLTVATVSLFGCANLASFSAGPLPVDADSPIAAAVSDALRNPGPYPKFSDVPKIPENAPNAASGRATTDAVQKEADDLARALAGLPPADVAATNSLLEELTSQVVGETPPAEDARARTEAMARDLRARATPPPAPK